MREQRVAFVSPKRSLGASFRGGRDIAEQRGIFAGADATHDLAGRAQLRLEWLLVNGRFQDDRGFFDENLRQIVWRIHVVKTSFALIRHRNHRVGR